MTTWEQRRTDPREREGTGVCLKLRIMMMNVMEERWVLAEDGTALNRWLGGHIATELVSACGKDATENDDRPKNQKGQ